MTGGGLIGVVSHLLPRRHPCPHISERRQQITDRSASPSTVAAWRRIEKQLVSKICTEYCLTAGLVVMDQCVDEIQLIQKPLGREPPNGNAKPSHNRPNLTGLWRIAPDKRRSIARYREVSSALWETQGLHRRCASIPRRRLCEALGAGTADSPARPAPPRRYPLPLAQSFPRLSPSLFSTHAVMISTHGL